MLLDGCHEGKHTPRLSEVRCPRCGEWVDIFVHMGGRPGQTGPKNFAMTSVVRWRPRPVVSISMPNVCVLMGMLLSV